jgi:hypothetical protein
MVASLTLKWGTVKGWDGLEGETLDILKRYFKDGVPMGCASDKPNEERRKILCELIDKVDGEIWNDWDGVVMTKDEARKYVTDYGN